MWDTKESSGTGKRAAIGQQIAIAALSTLALAVAGGAVATSTGAASVASNSRALNVRDEGHLHLVGTSGSLLVEEGPATGTLPGKVKARFKVEATITSSFTIYLQGGTITGQGHGTLHSTGLYSSFGGSMSVSHGTGRYAHAHGHGGFYGTINRHTYALTVQAIGKLAY